MIPPDTAVHADHVPSSGVVVLPDRVSNASVVPVGWLTSGAKFSHCTAVPESNRRETKTPVAA